VLLAASLLVGDAVPLTRRGRDLQEANTTTAEADVVSSITSPNGGSGKGSGKGSGSGKGGGSKSSKGGKVCDCEHPFYYVLPSYGHGGGYGGGRSYGGGVTFQQAVLGTPRNCILAPVSSKSVLNEIAPYLQSGTQYWVGAKRAVNSDLYSPNVGKRRNDWMNFDKSEVNSGDVWAPREPERGETFAYISCRNDESGIDEIAIESTYSRCRLNGSNVPSKFRTAVYKCCLDYCSDESVWEQLYGSPAPTAPPAPEPDAEGSTVAPVPDDGDD